MSAVHALPRWISFFVETAFGTGGPANWVTDGTHCFVTNVDTSGLVEQSVENENNITHPRYVHDMIHTLRNGSMSFGLHLHGKPGTVTAEAAQATTFHLAELARAALGGMRLGWSIGFSGGTASAPEVDSNPGYVVGDWIYAYDDSAGTGDFYRITAIAAGPPVVLTLDRDLHFTPAAEDVARAVISVYVHGRVTTSHKNANHKTLQILAQGDADDDIYIGRGCKPTMTLEAISPGSPLQASLDVAVTRHDAPDDETKKDFAALDPVGEAPLVPGRGASTKFKLANVGSPLVATEQRGDITVAPGVEYEPVTAAAGYEGVLGYVDTLGPAGMEVMVPFDSGYHADFRAHQHKQALITIAKSGTETEAIGVYFPELEIAAEPPRNDQGNLSGLSLSFRAQLNKTSAGSLTGDDKEHWLSPMCLLFTA